MREPATDEDRIARLEAEVARLREVEVERDALRHLAGPGGEAEQLRTLALQLAEAQRVGRLGGFDWDLATGQVAWSDVIYEIFEADRGFDTSFEAIFARVLPEDQQRIMGLIQRCLTDHEPIEDDYRIRRGDGTIGVLFTRASVVLDDAGRPVRVVGTAQDVTGRKALETELREANAALEEANRKLERALAEQRHTITGILDHAPAGISYLDHDLVYRWVNPVQAAMWGFAAQDVVGRSVFEVFGPRTEAQIGPLLRGVLATGEPYRATAFPFEHRDADGATTTTYWDFTYAPVLDDGHRAQGVLVLAIEVSDRIASERLQADQIARLRQLDALKDDFLSVLSHELRTPINAIMGFASILDDEVPGPLNPEQRRFTGRILGGADLLLALIDDLLDMSRIQAGKFALSREPVRFGDVVEQAVATIAPLAAQRGHAVEVDLAPDLPGLVADPQRVGQVLLNLLGNAVKFTPAGGRIAVRARAERAFLRCEVADTGEGIAPADQARLFERFTQLDSGNTRRAGGVGLGLSIVKALVEAHGGAVDVASTPGQGATFGFTLPLSRPG